MYIAIEGCSHGELDVIYATVERAEQMSGKRLDLLICCGDFQSVRNPGDLKCMAVPTKYMKMQSFYKYYSGEKKAPVLTIFIGGNHEASNYLQELPYGGWVAPNIYYLGYGGVVNVGGLRIGGVSGIYKGHDYLKGRFEKAPYTDSTIRSVYHVRNLEVFRMKQLHQQTPLDIFLSHDWPRGVTSYGDADALCRKKPFFKDEVMSNSLGSRSAQELLQHLKPRFWFAGHLHVKFAAVVGHEEDTPEIDAKSTLSDEVSALAADKKKSIIRHTRFLALDKCLPRRDFLQVLDIKFACKHRCQNGKAKGSSHLKTDDNKISSSSKEIRDLCFYDIYDNSGKVQLYHDLEWLTILRLTNHLQKSTPHAVYMPGPGGSECYQFTPTDEELKETLELMNNDLSIKPDQFCATAPAYDPGADVHAMKNISTLAQPEPVLNPYTADLCSKLRIDDPIAVMLGLNKGISKRQSFMVTPKRLPTAAEMNVTLNTSKLSSRDDAPDSDDEGSGDIVFEVSISSDSDGCSKGVLSPVVTPLRNGVRGARKSLLLSTPQRSGTLSDAVFSSTPSSSPPSLLKAASGDSASDHSPSTSPFCSLPASPVALLTASPLPSSNSDEPGSSQSCSADLEGSECSKSSQSQRYQSSDGEMEQPAKTSRTPLKLSVAHNSNVSEDVLKNQLNKSGSPKRLLSEDELVDAETQPIEHSSDKPFKIRRRNAAIYEATQYE